MKRIVVAFAILVAAWPSFITAQNNATRVQSGEHATFSRLVFAYQRLSGWRLGERTNDKLTITFEAGLPPLDLSAVFKRIPQTRLTGIEQRGAALELTLGCDCAVDVMRLGSNHMVIDISDESRPGRGDPNPLDLFAGATRQPILLRPFDLPAAPSPGPRLERLQLPVTGNDPRRHVNIRRTAPPAQDRPAPPRPAVSMCSFERIARDHLMAVPQEALAKLPHARRVATDETGEMQPGGARIVAELYLDIGWGQEALLNLASLPNPDLNRIALATVLDGGLPPPGSTPDPACGPASTVAALLSGLEPQTVRGLDGRALARFMADLPAARRTDIGPRVREVLKSANAETALSFLQLPEPEAAEPTDLAGTDLETVTAIIDSLRARNGEPNVLPEPILVNALAFRQSLPDGDPRDRLDHALVLALTASGHVVDAIRLAEQSNIPAETVLTTALDHLPPGQAAEAAIRLQPMIDSRNPAARRAARLFSTYGLKDVAALFAAPPAPVRTVGRIDAEFLEAEAEDPWLAGRFDELVEAETDPNPSPRVVVANLVIERDQTLPNDETGDLSRAEAELAAASALREGLAMLLAEPSS